MNLFRDYTFTWWQIALVKIYLFSLGLLGGAYFSEIVTEHQRLLAALAIGTGAYLVYAWWQNKI